MTNYKSISDIKQELLEVIEYNNINMDAFFKGDILECASKKMTYRQTIEEINRLDARRLELRTSLEEKYPNNIKIK